MSSIPRVQLSTALSWVRYLRDEGATAEEVIAATIIVSVTNAAQTVAAALGATEPADGD
jgi:alkylhydroperoxidase family enzyme